MLERPFIESGIRVDNISPLERRALNRELVQAMREAELRTIRDPDRRYPRRYHYHPWLIQTPEITIFAVDFSADYYPEDDYSEESFP